MFFSLRLCAVLLLLLGGQFSAVASLDQIGQAAAQQQITEETRLKVELRGAKNNVKVVRLADGTVGFVVKRLGADSDRFLTPNEFANLVLQQRESSGLLNTLLNITSPVGIAWVTLGLGGQILFTGRMLVQWIVSERSKRSVVPVAFWWMSLIGSSMLLIYFIWRRDIVGILGQATGWFIYIRNLVLIYRPRRQED